MALVENLKFESRGRQIRGTGRLNSRVPVTIAWTEAGKTLLAEGHTKDVSRKGCLAIVAHSLTVGQELRITNKVSQKTCEAVLVWRGHEGPGGWELGLELLDAPADFWEVDF